MDLCKFCTNFNLKDGLGVDFVFCKDDLMEAEA